MQNTIPKALVTGIAALSLAATVFAGAEPAVAAKWHSGGGFHGGAGRGGVWHGGRGGGWWGPAVVGGLAAGALLAAPYYTYGYGNCYGYQPMYDAYGNYIGQQPVRVC